MTIQEILHDTKTKTLDRHLGEALRSLSKLYDQKPALYGHETFEAISNDHRLMLDYMLRGFKDSQREVLYEQLLKRLYRLVADLEISWRCKNNPVYQLAFQRADHLNLSPSFVREVLERFVGDVAMLSLDAEEVARAKQKELYGRHQTFIERLFCSLAVACQWTKDEADDFGRIILSPTVDINDALLMTSAITLSAIEQFDLSKTLLLARIYQESREAQVRQRALVGFMLSLKSSKLFDKELTDCLVKLYQQTDFAMTLLEMQMQLFDCLNAERDSEKMENEIMPSIVKNSPLRATRFGIEEIEPDTLEEILHPDAADKANAEVEKNINRMFKMMQSGSDIYFGGFKLMKRFPFFAELSNWFAPFHKEHPALDPFRQKLEEIGYLSVLLSQVAFCDSDKYSLTFGMAQTVGRFPAGIRENLNNPDAIGNILKDEIQKTDAQLRRLYLQDLYRFFYVHPLHDQLFNPFEGESKNEASSPAFFLVSPLFATPNLNEQRLELARYLHRKRMWAPLTHLLSCFKMEQPEYYLLKGLTFLHQQLYQGAELAFAKALQLSPTIADNIPAAKGLATSLMRQEHYEEAAQTYAQLAENDAENISYPLNQSIALLETNRIAEATDLLFKLNYHHPENKDVLRVLAWALLLQKKTEQAARYYEQILQAPQPEDHLNAGYAAWVSEQPNKACEHFITFAKDTKADNPEQLLREAFLRDYKLLNVYGISNSEIELMIEAAGAKSR